ncbi:MAG: hypothetical protein WAQ08_06815 [Aquabacterium sp.]|uniref:hypothetical protein n=1 Tax=Aquabacterium sp. TaxID=1872578 RepID=UPI003BAF3F37
MTAKRNLACGWMLGLMVCSASAQAAPTPTLCQPDETVWFSCRIGQAKTVSLCGTPQTLQYRFGTPQRVELQYPKVATNGFTSFSWGHYSRSQVDRIQIGFDNHGTTYAVFDYTEGKQRDAGVEVNATKQLHCTSAPQSQLGKLKDKLPCDEDSALNLGHCPAQ